MGHATESLEHAEHVAHAAHGDHLSRRVGITMALLGVVLAFAAAKVGGQRTELTRALVDQQHAHAKFTQSDIKHRVAMLALQQLYATTGAVTNAKNVVAIAHDAELYLTEATLADEWVDTYDPLVEAHVSSQEHYELAELCAEFGIVIASIALLLKRREAWLVSAALGGVAVALLTWTYATTHGVVVAAEEKAEHTEKQWEDMYDANKTDVADAALVEQTLRSLGEAPRPKAPAHPDHE